MGPHPIRSDPPGPLLPSLVPHVTRARNFGTNHDLARNFVTCHMAGTCDRNITVLVMISQHALQQPPALSRIPLLGAMEIDDNGTSDVADASAVPKFGTTDFKLSEFCAHVAHSAELQEARIVATESYAESAGTVTHRFLVLELRRRYLADAWLRLDRRRGENTSIWSFLRQSGVTAANDRVCQQPIGRTTDLTSH